MAPECGLSAEFSLPLAARLGSPNSSSASGSGSLIGVRSGGSVWGSVSPAKVGHRCLKESAPKLDSPMKSGRLS